MLELGIGTVIVCSTLRVHQIKQKSDNSESYLGTCLLSSSRAREYRQFPDCIQLRTLGGIDSLISLAISHRRLAWVLDL
jgi:hypothetical protein